jgi:tRNA G46 methylase TrmB
MIYNFFHEGNPSTQLLRAVNIARKSYIKVNVEVRMRNCEILRDIAMANWAEYFIAIGKDQLEVIKAKSMFAELDPPNAQSFWGESQKLLPYVPEKSIDNFLLTLSQNLDPIDSNEGKLFLKNMLVLLLSKLTKRGTLQVFADSEGNVNYFTDLKEIAFQSGFTIDSNKSKVYFKTDRSYAEFIQEKTIVLVFKRKVEESIGQ